MTGAGLEECVRVLWISRNQAEGGGERGGEKEIEREREMAWPRMLERSQSQWPELLS